MRRTTAWYRGEGGPPLARRWAVAMESALRQTGEALRIGSNRYAAHLKVPGLRFWRVRPFPHLIFYIERADRIDVGRVLHERRDSPAWMAPPDDSENN